MPRDAAGLAALVDGTCGDPFALLGPHRGPQATVVRALLPGARAVTLATTRGDPIVDFSRIAPVGLFEARFDGKTSYLLRIDWQGVIQETEDPYAFPPLLGELDVYLLAQGKHHELGTCLGAHVMCVAGVSGVRFAVWAPNARRVSVVGDFNAWDGRRHPMRFRYECGVWELFLPRLGAGEKYKYEILGADGSLRCHADPVAWRAEAPPASASIVASPRDFGWTDAPWRARIRRRTDDQPFTIYELHASSWRRADDGGVLPWSELARDLIPYVMDLGFTHIELMPVMLHPFRGSWGYQPLGLFAPMPELGTPEDFARFVDRCHAAGLGVILDWVPGHFPADAYGLARFDGTYLYEYADPREGVHRDWNTLVYNLGRSEVRGFLLANALFWIEHFHADGLRVDAVAAMLYRDYSRRPGEWIPNRYGGRENLEAIDFLRELSTVVAERDPGTILIAEESTAWPGVTRAVAEGGLGFTYKWNMGWMHDTLNYIGRDPLYRKYHHDEVTFGFVYAFSEKFILPVSHDEVVYGKRSLLGKMPGDRWQRFANLRLYLGFMWAQPGKKLLFMGCEFGQVEEWSHEAALAWSFLEDGMHDGIRRFVRDLNLTLERERALFAADFSAAGCRLVVGDDRDASVLGWLRFDPGGASPVLAVANFTPVPRYGYRVGVPEAGGWSEILNSDATVYGGSGLGNQGRALALAEGRHGFPASLSLTLPPLAIVLLRKET